MVRFAIVPTLQLSLHPTRQKYTGSLFQNNLSARYI